MGWVGGLIGWLYSDYNASFSSNLNQLELPTGTELGKIKKFQKVKKCIPKIFLRSKNVSQCSVFDGDEEKFIK